MPLWPARLTWDRVHLVNGSYLCQPAGIRVVSNCHGQTNWRLVRYADFVVLMHGKRLDAETLRTEVAGVLAPMDLRLSVGETLVVKIDEGLDFLGFRFQRHEKRGTNRRCVYAYPSKTAVTAIKDKVRTLTRSSTQADLTTLLEGRPTQMGRLCQARRVQTDLQRPRPTPLGSPRSAKRRDPPGTRVLDVRGSPGWIVRRRKTVGCRR